MYKPLPDCVTIKESSIHGLGLFAKKFIPKYTNLGMTHIKDDRFENGYIRLPLGGFFNHSSNPNCEILEGATHDGSIYYLYLVTKIDIQEGEELTAFYTLYNPEQN